MNAVMEGTDIDLPCNNLIGDANTNLSCDNLDSIDLIESAGIVTCNNPGDHSETIQGTIRERVAEAAGSKSRSELDELKDTAKMIFFIEARKTYLETHVKVYHLARLSVPGLRFTPDDKNNFCMAQADRTETFIYNADLAKTILLRAEHLQTKAPLYYTAVAYEEYRLVAAKLYKDKLLGKLTSGEVMTFNAFFPNIIEDRILAYSQLARKIALMSNEIAGYFLGFPIQYLIPTDTQITTALEVLEKEGAEKYLERIKQTYMNIGSFPLGSISSINERDINFTEIDDYLPFDIVAYQSGTHVYRFTRIEFEHLIKSKKNHYTNEALPSSILSTIEARFKAAEALGLPKAMTAAEILESINNGTIISSCNIQL